MTEYGPRGPAYALPLARPREGATPMRGLFLLGAVVVVATTAIATQHGVWITGGFWTRSDFLGSTRAEQRAYATGLLDGALLAPFFGAPKDNPALASFERCMVVTDTQVTTILEEA